MLTDTTAAYGGYTKTGFGAQGGDDSGGFFAGGSQQGSQGGGGQKNFQDESLRPVTVKQILEADEAYSGADFKIDGQTVTQITAVGQVRSINPQPTNITIRIDDGTGTVEVKKFIDVDKQHEATNPGFEVDQHVRVFGRLKSFSGKRYVSAHLIRLITDPNEVNYHMLEATYVHLYFTKPQPGDNGGDGDGMFIDGGAGAGGMGGQSNSKLSGCSNLARRMHTYMNSASGGNEGVHLNNVVSGTGMSMNDVLKAAEELLGQGLIYTTVDDETWSILEY
ncbi:uncharacterized protein F5Z01DRAFT_669833 [Emericellopsis atlantica]|uniref:Replication protein A C-terminal domain-containing protein n=1 Tax=Emericellopsis atlantica TaxID=2614577 RepID=A0A9P7ZWT3_9HYPO|nr:uncharacterized protein F5Z01DRAFT_669833 [Emericellopsis atlantica]KAG9259102.1 hypothetical protein F5Z01DRAFT_669833 [Emericellopsis atlantica]